MHARSAEYRDIPTVVAMGRDFFRHAQPLRGLVPYSAKDIATTLQRMIALGHLLVAENDDGQVVGMIGAMVAPCYWNFSELQGIEAFWWITPAGRQTGAGKALREGMEQRMRDCGVKYWYMVALESSSPEAVGADYERHGYEVMEHNYLKVLD